MKQPQQPHWIDDIKDELPDIVDGDTALLLDAIGHKALAALWDKLTGINIYISSKPQLEAKKLYIIKNWNHNTKELALKLGVSDRFVQKALRDARAQKITPSLFDD